MSVNRRQAFSNFSWKLAEQVGSQMVSFIVSIILARLLMPDDYSVVSIVVILSSFCAVFIDGGLSKSLIQKKNSDVIDFSTVLFVCIGISIILYLGLFLAAPIIAGIYDKEVLVSIVRIYSLTLIIGAFNTVQCAYISKKLQFKKYFFATIVGTAISAVVGIYMAYSGCGAWSLVAQQMINSVIDTLILFLTTEFRPKLCFSIERLKQLWGYGIKVLGTSLVDMLYDNIRPLIVGFKFTTADLAYYQKGKSYPNIVNSTLNSTMSAVLFPVIATIQDDYEQVKNITQKYIRIASFLIFPSLLGLAAISENLIVLMITEKWIQSVPYMQIFCINYMFLLLQTGNLQAINAIGRSDIVFRLAIIKKSVNFLLLFLIIAIAPSPLWLAAIGIFTSLLAFVINAFTNKSLLHYGFFEQVKDILPNLISSVIMAALVLAIGRVKINRFIVLVLQIVIGGVTYIGIAFITRNSNLIYCLDTMKAFFKHR